MGISDRLTELARSMLWGDDFRSRLVREFLQLRDRLELLESFILTKKFGELSEEDRSELYQQRTHMRAYFEVLSKRVDRLCGGIPK